MTSSPSSFETSFQPRDYGPGTLLALCLWGVVSATLYAIITHLIGQDLLLIGLLIAFALPLILVLKWVARKRGINRVKRIATYTAIAFTLAFSVRIAVRSFLIYRYTLIPLEIQFEREEGSYTSPEAASALVDQFLKEQTGYGSYVGAFLWDLSHTTITHNHYTSDIGPQQAAFWWLLEFAFGIGFAYYSIPSELKKLGVFCERCKNPKIQKFFVFAPSKSFGAIKRALKQKDFRTLETLYQPSEAQPNDFTSLAVWGCEHCRHAEDPVEIDLVVSNRRQSRPVPLRVSLSPSELSTLKTILR